MLNHNRINTLDNNQSITITITLTKYIYLNNNNGININPASCLLHFLSFPICLIILLRFLLVLVFTVLVFTILILITFTVLALFVFFDLFFLNVLLLLVLFSGLHVVDEQFTVLSEQFGTRLELALALLLLLLLLLLRRLLLLAHLSVLLPLHEHLECHQRTALFLAHQLVTLRVDLLLY